MGNNREVWLANIGATIQRTQYYPSGLPWAESTGQSVQNKKYNSKEFVEAHGLDEYDSEARWYYPAIMRTTTLDPLAEKYYSISPYAWCNNNPVKFIDPDGRLFDEFEYNIENNTLQKTGDDGGKTTQTITVVNGKGETIGVAKIQGENFVVAHVASEINNSNLAGVKGDDIVATNDNKEIRIKQEYVFDANLTQEESAEINKNEETISKLRAESYNLGAEAEELDKKIRSTICTELGCHGATQNYDIRSGAAGASTAQTIRTTFKEIKYRRLIKKKSKIDSTIDSISNVNNELKK